MTIRYQAARRHFLKGVVLAVLLASLVAYSPAKDTRPSGSSASLDENLTTEIHQSKGKLTPALREGYCRWAENTVLQQLEHDGCSVSPECLAEVRGNADLHDAIFSAIYPPDPSILQRYAVLRERLGPRFTKRYCSLLTAVAVQQRSAGMARNLSALYEDGTKQPDKQASTSSQEDPLVLAIADFMKAGRVAALDLWRDDAQKKALREFLAKKKLDPSRIEGIADSKHLHWLLRQAMVVLGQRPAERDPMPSMVTWLWHLGSIYEAVPTIPHEKRKTGPTTWPLFPMDKAPWPLLMPLAAYRWPIREADYLWDKFQGKTGDGRFHTYGPYRKTAAQMPYMLRPMPWHWNSIPSQMVVGGVCTVMAGLEVATRVSLCQPAFFTGQHKHSCLMVSSVLKDGKWGVAVHQATTCAASWPRWFFREFVPLHHDFDKTNGMTHVGVEYQLGLTCALNVGLSKYMDTRIAVNVYRAMPRKEQRSLGKPLLEEAVRTNPFNAEAWYYLALATTDAADGIAVTRAARQGITETLGDDEELDTTGSLEKYVTRQVENANAEKAAKHYWRILRGHILQQAILRHPMPATEADARKVYEFLQSVGGATMPYRFRFEGKNAIQTSLQTQVKKHLAGHKGHKGKEKKGNAEHFAHELTDFLAGLSGEERLSAISSLKALFLRDATGDPYFDALSAAGPASGTKSEKTKHSAKK